MTWHQVRLESDLEIDKPVSIEIDGEPVLVVLTNDGVFALSDTCSHAEVSLAEGIVSDGKIECWLHGAQFELKTGAALCLPATRGIETYSVRFVQQDSKKELEISLKRQEM